MCTACGGMGQPCCGGGGGGMGVPPTPACTTGLSCAVGAMGNTCGMCGATGQPCCAGGGGFGGGGGSCGAGNRCVMDSCVVCGGMGQPCCPGGGLAACTAGLTCNPSGVMGTPASCGPPGQRPDAGARD
jgi:hypothetical protein